MKEELVIINYIVSSIYTKSCVIYILDFKLYSMEKKQSADTWPKIDMIEGQIKTYF